ncbi:phospholipase A1-like [Coccinella septempunctata]|uniref:phospholipase A1-like n=1 Tax=Coccinella septempunctata TaxID=41139 RepID=UPI001D06B13A|nr:phospholipase A1-like [Coccinella septempunctata]XP_044745612.1 phospholipase A1-like [Coccinella septempunctata]
MKLLCVLLIPFYCQNVSAGLLGNILSTVSDVSSKVASVADSAIGGTLSTIQEVTGKPVSLNEIKFYLFTNANQDEPLIVNPSNPTSLADPYEKVFFLIHGRQQNTHSPWMRNLSKSLLKRYVGCKVVHVDWRGPANQEYPVAVFNTESVGKHVADLIKKINTDHSVPTRNIVLIGFSLGSQVCGFTGKYYTQLTGTKLPKIIALDPAGVLFVLRPEAKRLNANDATVVQVVHTDGGKIGLTQPCGTIDFYPNGGKDQPGCPHVEGFSIRSSSEKLRLLSLRNVGNLIFSANCDHERAYQYFLESVENYGSFAAKKCYNFEEVGSKNCSGKVVAMGDLDLEESGVFYLETNSYAPFSKSSTDESLFSTVFGGDGQIDIRIQK